MSLPIFSNMSAGVRWLPVVPSQSSPPEYEARFKAWTNVFIQTYLECTTYLFEKGFQFFELTCKTHSILLC